MAHKDRHKKLLRDNKKRKRKKLKKSLTLKEQYMQLYANVFMNELEPYKDRLEKLAESGEHHGWRVVDNPVRPSNYISKREMSILEHRNDENYMYIPNQPNGKSDNKMLRFLSEYGLSNYDSPENCDKAMIDLYDRLASAHGTEVAEIFFEKHGHYMVEMIYNEDDGWKLPTSPEGHFDFIRTMDWDYETSLTGNYKKINITWHEVK